MEQKTIGKFIAVLRKSQGMTQKELAEKLGVSDKTVSHWERDESAPDISLIPVIAEIFSVTCDELLRGEKSSYQSETSVVNHENDLSEKGEKQIRYLFEKALSRLKMKSIICAGIDAVGFVVSLIVTYLVGMKLGSETEYTGLLFAAVFYIVSLALTGVFRFQFGTCVKNDDFALSESYSQKANMVTFLIAGLTAIVFCYTLPVCTRYLSTGEQFVKGSVYAAVCLVILLCVLAVLKSKGLISSKQRTKKQKKLFRLRVLTLVITAAVILGSAALETAFINYDIPEVFDSVSFDDVESFLETISSPTPIPDYADDETRWDLEEKMSPGTTHSVEFNGEEYTFEWKNGDIANFDVTVEEDGRSYIDVYYVSNPPKRAKLGALQDRVFMAGYIYYPAIVLIAVLIYILVSRKIRKSE
ncbi:MAG: helix-turn-helix domain-containing protein [Acutalibacteraceae bacterium]